MVDETIEELEGMVDRDGSAIIVADNLRVKLFEKSNEIIKHFHFEDIDVDKTIIQVTDNEGFNKELQLEWVLKYLLRVQEEEKTGIVSLPDGTGQFIPKTRLIDRSTEELDSHSQLQIVEYLCWRESCRHRDSKHVRFEGDIILECKVTGCDCTYFFTAPNKEEQRKLIAPSIDLVEFICWRKTCKHKKTNHIGKWPSGDRNCSICDCKVFVIAPSKGPDYTDLDIGKGLGLVKNFEPKGCIECLTEDCIKQKEKEEFEFCCKHVPESYITKPRSQWFCSICISKGPILENVSHNDISITDRKFSLWNLKGEEILTWKYKNNKVEADVNSIEYLGRSVVKNFEQLTRLQDFIFKIASLAEETETHQGILMNLIRKKCRAVLAKEEFDIV